MKLTNLEKNKNLKGDIVFESTTHPYNIFVRGMIYDGLGLKNAKGTRFEFYNVLYYTKRYESSLFVYDEKVVVENIDKDNLIRDFVIELLEIGMIRKAEKNV